MAKSSPQKDSPIGKNRTGVQMSPIQIDKMLAGMDSKLAMPSSSGDESAIAELRAGYIAEADPLGSVPPPATVKGTLKSGAKMMMGERPQVLLDKLGERLAFERTGTRLYEALINKCQASKSKDGGIIDLARLKHFHDEEARHFALVAQCMEKLGADPTAQTPCADIAGVESMGLLQVVTDPKTTPAQSLHAIVIGELTDNAGWDELIVLAEELDMDEMAEQFTEAREHEREHLQTVRDWHEQLTLAQANV
jgi:rubrerythrin